MVGIPEYPVIIVGAGPAGTAAALTLARQGVQPILLDRSHFPREKVCGDGLTYRALQLLKQLDLLKEIYTHPQARAFPTARAYSREKLLFCGSIPHLSEGQPGFVTLPRKHFDYLLLQTACHHGIEFLDGFTVTGLIREGNKKIQGIQGKRWGKDFILRSSIVIGADGVFSRIARESQLFKQNPRFSTVAIRAYVRTSKPAEDSIEIFYDRDFVPGFGWVFPLAEDLVNIGVGIRMDRLKKCSLQKLFQHFLKDFPILTQKFKKLELLAPPRGSLIPGYGQSSRIFSDGILLVGDAASLTDPLTGEGISYALESGIIAGKIVAQAVKENCYTKEVLQSYQREIRHRFNSWLRFAHIFQNWPHLHKATEALALRGQKDPEFAQRLIWLAAGYISKREIARWEFLAPSVLGYWREKFLPK